MTITTDTQMWQALEQIDGMQHAVAALRSDIQPISATNFAILAEGPLAQIRDLQAQVDAYQAVSAAERDPGALWIGLVGDHLRFNDAPTSVLTAILDTLRKRVQTVTEILMKGRLSVRPTAALTARRRDSHEERRTTEAPCPRTIKRYGPRATLPDPVLLIVANRNF